MSTPASGNGYVIKYVNPSILVTDVRLRFVTVYSTLTKRGDFAPWALILAKDRIECGPAPGEFIDKFLYYNAKIREEKLAEIITKEFELSNAPELKQLFLQNAAIVVKAIDQIRKFLEGVGFNANVLYGALLLEGVHFAKVIISRGVDMGAIRYQLRSLVTTTTFVPYLCPMRIIDIVKYYETMYERIGRPYFARASRKDKSLLQRIRKLTATDVDQLIDIVVDSIGNSRLLAVLTHLFIISKQAPEHAVHVDAKRCIAIPPPQNIVDVLIIQSQDTGIVCLIYDLPPEKLHNNVRVITRTMIRKYVRGILTDRESGIISTKISKTVYGLSVAEEMESLDIKRLFGEETEETGLVEAGETEETVTVEAGTGTSTETTAPAAGKAGEGEETTGSKQVIGGEEV